MSERQTPHHTGSVTIRVHDLVLGLEEAEDTLRALRTGAIDAVVVEGPGGEQVLSFRETSHAYRVLVETMNEGAALLTAAGLVSYCNPRFSELTGVPAEALVGEPLRERFAAGDRAACDALLERARHEPARDELEVIRADGEAVPVLLSLSPAHIDDVPVLCLVATDLTERKRQEAMFHEMRAALGARERLMAVASHELRSPLSALAFQLESLMLVLRRSEQTGPEAERAVAMVDRAKRYGVRLAALVDALLDLARIGGGGLTLAPEEFDLRDAAMVAMERLEPELQRSGTTVRIDAQPARGFWDRMRLEQVAVNLLSNAIKYGRGRPVVIKVSAAGDLVRLSVEDQGIGIAPEARERIFRPFERAAAAGDVAGLGLGLYISSEIVAAHGGSIRVESEEGRGSRFTVELPRQGRRVPPAGG